MPPATHLGPAQFAPAARQSGRVAGSAALASGDPATSAVRAAAFSASVRGAGAVSTAGPAPLPPLPVLPSLRPPPEEPAIAALGTGVCAGNGSGEGVGAGASGALWLAGLVADVAWPVAEPEDEDTTAWTGWLTCAEPAAGAVRWTAAWAEVPDVAAEPEGSVPADGFFAAATGATARRAVAAAACGQGAGGCGLVAVAVPRTGAAVPADEQVAVAVAGGWTPGPVAFVVVVRVLTVAVVGAGAVPFAPACPLVVADAGWTGSACAEPAGAEVPVEPAVPLPAGPLDEGEDEDVDEDEEVVDVWLEVLVTVAGCVAGADPFAVWVPAAPAAPAVPAVPPDVASLCVVAGSAARASAWVAAESPT